MVLISEKGKSRITYATTAGSTKGEPTIGQILGENVFLGVVTDRDQLIRGGGGGGPFVVFSV